MAYGDGVMEAIRGTVLDGRPRVGGVSDGEAARRERRRLALSAAAEYARSGRGGQGDADMHLERAAEEALSQAAFAGIMTYGRSALALGRRTLADQLARRRASAAMVLRRSRYQEGPFGEGVETLSDATLNPSTLTGARPAGRLGEVATVSEEYSRAYPGMERDVVVNVVPDSAWDGYVAAAKRARAEWAKTSDTSRGFFDRRLSAVSIRAQMPGETMEAYFDRADRTLVHELQHYAQMRDGLPATSPGSGYEWYRTAAREVEARNSANRLALTPQERLEMPRANTQDVKPKDVHLDDEGGRASKWTWDTYRWNPEAKGGQRIDPKNIKGTGRSFDAAKERLKVPEGRKAEFEKWMDGLANLPKEIEVEGRKVPIQSFLVPKDWRTNTKYNQDYDYVAAFLADARPGPLDHGEEGWFWHMGGAGKMPTHPTFSAESYYAKDPRWADLAGTWDGETYIPGKAERETRQAAKGGDNFGTFRNFLATDDVPESIFGFPVVQDKSQYTEGDLEFFRRNPKAAGFYDLGDEEMDEDVPQQAAGAGEAMGVFEPYVERDSNGALSSVFGVPVRRSLYPGEDTFFKAHKDVAGMAAEDSAIILNPYSANQTENQELVAVLEAARHHMKRMGDAVPAFTLTPGQRGFFSTINDGRPYGSDEDIRHTILSRIIIGDKSAGDVTKAQRDAAGVVYRYMKDHTPVVKPRGKYPGSLNNPGNVEKRKERRQGEVDSPSERFAKFATPQDGLREMADVIRQVATVKLTEKGLPFTVRNFAGVYAPGAENDTAKYVADISADSGFGPDEELHRFDEGDMARLLKSVVRFESGALHSAWFTDEEYAEAAKKLQEGAVD